MKKLQISIIFLFIVLFSLIATTRTTIPTITYFPPDDSVHFTEIINELSFTNNTLHWKTKSTTNKKTYLRQDISLLYVNGYFNGFMNAWQNNGQTITFEEFLESPPSGLYMSTSYHYSETQSKNRIRSRAVMSSSSLTIDCEVDLCEASKPHVELSATNELESGVFIPLHDHWKELTDHFHIDLSQFDQIALTDLIMYEDRPLPPYSQEKTDEIIHHLWEGLYANYIVELMNLPEEERGHFMPLILYSEQELYILYELHGKKEQLIQRISM